MTHHFIYRIAGYIDVLLVKNYFKGGICLKEVTEQQPIFVGCDAGNSEAKIAYFAGREVKLVSIPNINGPAFQLSDPPAGPDEKIISANVLSSDDEEIQDSFYFIGELARLQLQSDAEQDRDRDKANSDAANLIIPAVLGLFGNEKIVLALGATLTDHDRQAPFLIQKLTGKHQVAYQYGTLSGQIVQPEVLKTYTFGQCIAGLTGLITSEIISAEQWLDTTVMGLDFGHGQINIGVLQGLKKVERASFSLDYGFYEIYSAIQDYLNAAPYYVTLTIPELQEVIEKGYYLKQGKKISIEKPMGEACNTLMDKAFREIKARIVGRASQKLYDSISQIVIMGGAGPVMAPYVGSKYETDIYIAPEAKFINAIGLAHIAKNNWESEHDQQ
jgi:hypothetical protein